MCLKCREPCFEVLYILNKNVFKNGELCTLKSRILKLLANALCLDNLKP